eukprot:TRINITY_DN90974_c0_g1_i1.p1 TRINITY_DN90974_c0_g1~~TRINITY_DN90974_c0_g1_i1.p1  ORF type:complete len:669 (+),score=105.22 TRINITY_DN90974_c0_g1_i1:39-2009(+)
MGWLQPLRHVLLQALAYGLVGAHAGQGGLRPKVSGGATAWLYAPQASQVSIGGPWEFWVPGAEKLLPQGDGWWALNISSDKDFLLKHGSAYQFKLALHDGREFLKADPWSRMQDGKTLGNSIAYDDNAFEWSDSAWQMPPWNELVIYELHVGTFGRDQGSTSSATLDACISKLDHLVELGINAVELMPVAEFDGDMDWGYTSAYLYAVEHAYGGPDGFKRFVDACHRRGIAVLVDVVYNHLGPQDLALWQFDGWSENFLGGIYFYNDARAETPWGHTRPNYGLDHVRRYLTDNVLFWLDTMHCDGLRVDGVSFIRLWGGSINRANAVFNPEGESFLKDINRKAQALGRKLIIAEDLQSNATLTQSLAAGGLGFDSQWDLDFSQKVRKVLRQERDEARNMTALQEAVLGGIGGGLRRTLYTESHDTASHMRLPRYISMWEPLGERAQKLFAMGSALALTSPGIPMLFQGQEMMIDETFTAYAPMNWAMLFMHYGQFKLHQRLIKLRRNVYGTTRGLTGSGVQVWSDEAEKVLTAHRWDQGGPGDDVFIVFNFQGKDVQHYNLTFPVEGLWKRTFNSNSAVYSSTGLKASSKAEKHGANDSTGHKVLAESAGLLETEMHLVNFRGRSVYITLPSYSCMIYTRLPERRLRSRSGENMKE